jgi:ubiquinone/menaquinone biosynthesis C-methylase UbiE
MNTAPDLQRTFTGEIPRNYDRFLGPAWFRGHSAEVVRFMPADPGGDVLELACGTGLSTEYLRKRLDPRRRLVATDLSGAMLDYARAKLANLEGITWQTADAGRLPFADGEFAALACSFGVMFVPDRKAVFSEARRVLKPGGLFVFNVWDRMEDNPCALAYEEVMERMFPGDKEVLFRVPYLLADEELVRELLDGAGFTAQRIEKVCIPVQGPARDVATGQVRGTPRGLMLAKRGVEFDDAIGQVTEALEKRGGKGASFRLDSNAIMVEAVAR